jgi:hypothetical protein
MEDGVWFNEWLSTERQFNIRLTELREVKSANISDARLIELPTTKEGMVKWLMDNFHSLEQW